MSWDDYCFEDHMESYERSNGDDHYWRMNTYRDYDPPKRQSYPKDTRSLELANTLKGLLKKGGIKINGINQAASGSCYLTFTDDRIGKCRIGNHEELRYFGYRWQVRWDIKEKYVNKGKGHNQFVYPSNGLDELVKHIKNYHNKILGTGDEFECVDV